MKGYRYISNTYLSSDLLSDFCRHVGAMCSAGVPLGTAMEILQRGTDKKRVKKLYEELQSKMEQGSSFSNAMEMTGAFPEFLVHIFRAAEISGHLEEAAKQMTIYYRKEHKLRNQIRTATLYPKVLCLMSIFVMVIVCLVIVPTVEPLFRGVELTLLTRVILAICNFLKRRWYVVAGVAAALFLTIPVLAKRSDVRAFADRVKIEGPLIAKSYKIIYTARFARSMCQLYSSGLPMVESLKISSKTIGNSFLETQLERVIDIVRGGASLSEAVEVIHGLDKKLAPIIFVGEETGMLDEMLGSLAESYEYDAEMEIRRMVTMMEPAMILIMGMIIGMILLSIMIPMWSMYGYMA